MAKLTNRQRKNIVAKWDTGAYSKTQLAKSYKVTEKVIRNIVGKEEPKNADVVEAGVVFSQAKNDGKSPIEVREIDNAIKHKLDTIYSDDKKRIKIYDITDKVLDKVKDILEKGTKEVAIKLKTGYGLGEFREEVEIKEVGLDTSDLKNIQDTVDKASVTNNVNQRHANSQINVNTQNNMQQNHVELNQKVVKDTLKEFEDEY